MVLLQTVKVFLKKRIQCKVTRQTSFSNLPVSQSQNNQASFFKKRLYTGQQNERQRFFDEFVNMKFKFLMFL